MSNVCRAYDEVCEHATEYGYCRLTVCAKRSQTITVSKDKTVSYTNDVVWCKDCKYQGECEQIVVFDIHVDEVQGHRVESCSYGKRREDGEV